MKNLKFIGDAYAARSQNAAGEKTINMYPEVDQHNRSVIALFGTPGLVTKVTLGAAAVVRQLFNYDGVLYAVCGNKFYTLDTSYVATERGTLTTSTGYVSLCTNGLVVLIVDGTDGYTWTISSSTFATISDVDFPANPVKADILDNTFIVVDGGSQRFYISTDGTAWGGADFASAEGSPDDLLSLIVDHQEIIFGGVDSTEVWYNSGDATFTFARRAVIESGVAGVGAMCKADNSVFFLGKEGVVWRLNGYTPVRVSTYAIEYAIGKYSTSDVIMWSQKQDGHIFIWMQFPTGLETWVYDVASNMWHQRAYMTPATGAFTRHKANCYTFFNRKHVVGDHSSGKVYELDIDTYSDAGDELKAVRACRHIVANGERIRHSTLELFMEAGVGLVSGQGSDPQVMLRFSDDGGHVWSNESWGYLGNAIGDTGEYKTRIIFRRLGASRDRIYEASITDPVKRVFTGAALNGVKGNT